MDNSGALTKSALSDKTSIENKPSIDFRGLIIKLSFIIIVALVVSWLSFLELYHQKLKELQVIQQDRILSATAVIERELGNLEESIRLLQSNQLIHAAPVDKRFRIEQLERYFSSFGAASSYISQIRWLDIYGQEIIRTEFKNGQSKVIPSEKLQDKSGRYYFTQGMQIDTGQIYISFIDLNVENGRLQLPLQPTVRVSVKTHTDTHAFSGLLIINYDLSRLFDKLSQLQSDIVEFSVLNNEGYWLINKNQAKEWGFALNQKNNTLAQQDPDFWQTLNKQEQIVGKFVSANLVTSHKLSVGHNRSNNSSDLILLAQTREQNLSELKIYLVIISAIVGFSILLLGLAVVVREFNFQRKLLHLTAVLDTEKKQLHNANQKLEQSFVKQQQLQQELVESQKLASLGSLAAGVAHELNTPLGSAITSATYASSAIQQLQKDAEKGLTKSAFSKSLELVGEGLQLCHSNLERAANQIESFKRMVLNRKNESIVDFNVSQVLNDLVDGFKASLGEYKPHINCSVNDQLTMHSYPGLFSQVIQYLLDNALVHGFDDVSAGVILITIKKISDGKIQCTVVDDGNGIANELKEKIFQPFITHNRGQGHTGLGLYFVHQWVTQILKGNITCKSEPQKGSCFTIVIPQTLSNN